MPETQAESTTIQTDSGLACLFIVARHYDKNFKEEIIRKLPGFGSKKTLLSITEAAEKIEFKSRIVKLNYKQLLKEVQLPCILELGRNHFVVLFNGPNIIGPDKIRCVSPAT